MQLRFDNPNGAEIVGAIRQSRRFDHARRLCCLNFTACCNSSGSLAIFAAIWRASSLASNFAPSALS
jgi:hypothetical protein